MGNKVCENCKYYESSYDEAGKDMCTDCDAGHSEKGNPYPNWEPKEEKTCDTCKHLGDLVGICAWCKAHSSVSCQYPRWAAKEEKTMGNEWYIDAIKEGIRQAEEKRKEEPKNSSGRYPWEETRHTHTYSGWINEIFDECHEKHIQVGDYYQYIDMMLQANIADELHRLNDILSRRKG